MSHDPKVLLVRLSSLGDVVLVTAAVTALQEDLPGAEVHVLTKPAFGEVFQNHPGVSRVLRWDPSEGLGALAHLVRTGDYGWVVDLHGNLRTRVLRLLVRGPRWSVYRKGAVARRLSVWCRRPGLAPPTHVVDRYIQALAPLAVGPERRLPRVYPSPGDLARVEEVLRGAGWDGTGPAIALAPGARWPTKAWPQEHWGELAASVAQGRLGFPVLLGGEGEQALGDAVLALSGAAGANLAGRTSILETAAVLQLAAALVSNDSAPLHLATAVGTPAVALFGPTVPGFGFYPLGPDDALLEVPVDCRPCSLHGDAECRRRERQCLTQIRPEDVLSRLRQQILREGSTAPAAIPEGLR